MSGLLALLDDVAAIAKLAATSVDDIAGQAAKAGVKASGAVIDDAAVTPKFVHGIPAARELPMVGRIALGSVRNKLVFLLPAALILSAFAPGLIQPLLMLGGGYLAYEGAEKVLHWLRPGHAPGQEGARNAARLEEARVKGAIKTDFILSAEIMTIILAEIAEPNLWWRGAVLALAGLMITAVVYGGVALIVKADDLGLYLARVGRLRVTRVLGRGLVRAMPGFLAGLAAVGTVAMLWVGGAIVAHGLASFHVEAPEHVVRQLSDVAAGAVPGALSAAAGWAAGALSHAVIALGLGAVLLALVSGGARLWGKGGH
ncbi:ABC transporter [Defluviimonas sp. 20V17]|uniref:Inner membrane protein YedI n=1 Tax=Allgaiera indica TaxID=765699 RepID=A0AAN4ZZK9_9RHOB|nr:DUF808 domain-containing protein [Allgaiera indica]KDB01882.1 ABC transporter [Defluviimonas sp. 20V17]GHE02400.1 hypothetical protein GCM10008024_21710 [Allgaiera indica]SDX30405.1 hypothetical protein SAMN05444006_11385 [Allgaiera indica]